MFSVIKDKIVKIRKPRNCWGCDKHFPAGSYMQYVFCSDSGDASSAYWCSHCMTYVQKNWRDYEDGVYRAELLSNEHYQDFILTNTPKF